MRKILMITLMIIVSKLTSGQQTRDIIVPVTETTHNDEAESRNFHKSTKSRINLFIFTRERKKKIDLLAFYTLLRARIKSLFHHKNFMQLMQDLPKMHLQKLNTFFLRESLLRTSGLTHTVTTETAIHRSGQVLINSATKIFVIAMPYNIWELLRNTVTKKLKQVLVRVMPVLTSFFLQQTAPQPQG